MRRPLAGHQAKCFHQAGLRQHLVRNTCVSTGQTYVLFDSFYKFPGPGTSPIRFVSKIHFWRFFGQPFGETTFSKNVPKRKYAHGIGFPMPEICFCGEPFVKFHNTKVLLN